MVFDCIRGQNNVLPAQPPVNAGPNGGVNANNVRPQGSFLGRRVRALGRRIGAMLGMTPRRANNPANANPTIVQGQAALALIQQVHLAQQNQGQPGANNQQQAPVNQHQGPSLQMFYRTRGTDDHSSDNHILSTNDWIAGKANHKADWEMRQDKVREMDRLDDNDY